MTILNPWNIFWQSVWKMAESLSIPLGRFAPWVFGQMLGAKRKRIEPPEENE